MQGHREDVDDRRSPLADPARQHRAALDGLFLVSWALSVLIWKTQRIEERWGSFVVRE
jgi:hypothetical protein